MTESQTETLDSNAFVELVHINYESTLKKKFRGFVIQKRSYMDASVDEDDLYQSMLAVLPRYAESLQQPLVDKKTGKIVPLIARLLGFARRHALSYLKKTKRRFDIIANHSYHDPYDLVSQYCETVTPLEMAALKADRESRNEEQ
jgi:hypothetical protein